MKRVAILVGLICLSTTVMAQARWQVRKNPAKQPALISEMKSLGPIENTNIQRNVIAGLGRHISKVRPQVVAKALASHSIQKRCAEDEYFLESVAKQANNYYIAQYILIQMADPMALMTDEEATPKALCYASYQIKGQGFIPFVRTQAPRFRPKEQGELEDFANRVERLVVASGKARIGRVAIEGARVTNPVLAQRLLEQIENFGQVDPLLIKFVQDQEGSEKEFLQDARMPQGVIDHKAIDAILPVVSGAQRRYEVLKQQNPTTAHYAGAYLAAHAVHVQGGTFTIAEFLQKYREYINIRGAFEEFEQNIADDVKYIKSQAAQEEQPDMEAEWF